jgi:predicted dehydrogenase
MATYTAAIIGCGDIAHAHMAGYRDNNNVEVVAVVDPVETARQQFIEEYDIPQSFASVEEMFAALVPDLVSVCTWHLLHPAPTVAAAQAGVKAVICEKPMAVGLGPADEMVEACRQSGTKLIISHQRRFTPGWEKARQLVQEGAIGQIQRVDSKVPQGLLNCGTHAIDGVRFILGDPETAWVMGAVERDTERFERDTPIEDGCMGLVHMKNGIQLFVQSDLDLEGASPGRFWLRGSEGMIETTETETRLFNATSSGWQDIDLGVERIDVIGGKANGRQVKELIAWIEGGPPHRGAGETARETVAIMMALYESARQHRAIHFPLEEKGYPLQSMLDEGRLDPSKKGPYDIRGYLKRDDIDEKRYAELRAEGMGHHGIMRRLYEELES